jgi:hypothetical protein
MTMLEPRCGRRGALVDSCCVFKRRYERNEPHETTHRMRYQVASDSLDVSISGPAGVTITAVTMTTNAP